MALSCPFDPVCLSFLSDLQEFSAPFPLLTLIPFKPLIPFPGFTMASVGRCCIGFPASGLLVSPSPTGWHTGSRPLCVFTKHSFLSASLPQAACYCSCGVFLTAFPHKFNTTTPLVQNKRGWGACWGLHKAGVGAAFLGSVLCHCRCSRQSVGRWQF